MTAQTQIVPSADASDDVSDWWMETFDPENERGDLVHALYETTEGWDSQVVARGANGYGYRDYDTVTHYFIGLTVENRDAIRFIDLPAFIDLGEQHGFDASKQIGEWQDRMDLLANE